MEPFTILLLILAAALLLLSCFLPEKKEEQQPLAPDEELIARLAKRELSPEEMQRMQEAVDRVISEKTEEAILKTDDYLSKVANEKIIAVDEFSKQIMERLGKDNSDAAFLYKMIAEAKEELKSDITEARKEKFALEKLIEEGETAGAALEAQKRSIPKTGIPVMAGAAFAEGGVEEEPGRLTRKLSVSGSKNEKKLQTRVASREKPEADEKKDDITQLLADFYSQGVREPEPEPEPEPQPVPEREQELPKDKILALHKKGYSVREISKELSMGQGEVKLVIDLYGA